MVETNLTAVYQIKGMLRKRWALYGIRGREVNSETNSEECCDILYTHGIHIAAQGQDWFLYISFLNRTMTHMKMWPITLLIYFCNT